MKKKQILFIGIALAAPVLLSVLLSVNDGLGYLTAEIVDYPQAKSGSSSTITLAVTNHFYFVSQRITAIEIQQLATPNSTAVYSTFVRSGGTLAPQSGKFFTIPRPAMRGRWQVCVRVCPYWRERLDNSFTRKMNLRFLWAVSSGTCSDWIDD